MGLFYSNDVSGKGVSKNLRKKKPFFLYWERFGENFGRFFKINLVYFLFCIPIVTFGPATAAMTALMRNIYLDRPMFVFHDFWEQFKKNFKQSFFIGILDIGVIVGAVFAFRYFSKVETDMTGKIIYALSIAATVLFVMMNFYIYPQIAAMNMKLGSIIRNSLILVFVNLGGELITLALLLGYAALLIFFNIYVLAFIPFVPGAWICYTMVFTCYPAIQKHLINPYYEKSGEKNPEIPDYEEEAVFEDQGGKEQPINLKKNKNGGRVIK